MIADTSGLLALFNQAEPAHAAVAAVVAEETEPLRELAGGAYVLSTMGPEDVAAAAAIVEEHADQAIGLADASLLVLAERHGTQQVLTLDRRHFDVLQLPSGQPVRLLPS